MCHASFVDVDRSEHSLLAFGASFVLRFCSPSQRLNMLLAKSQPCFERLEPSCCFRWAFFAFIPNRLAGIAIILTGISFSQSNSATACQQPPRTAPLLWFPSCRIKTIQNVPTTVCDPLGLLGIAKGGSS